MNKDTLKIHSPIITHETSISETHDRESMAIIPVPDSQAIMGVPISTINGFLGRQINKSLEAELDARELLTWNDGIGSLDGCDLRFKINQQGCLELLDSDDEELSEINNRRKRKELQNRQIQQQQEQQLLLQQQQQLELEQLQQQEQQLDQLPNQEDDPQPQEENRKEISPGSSLLRGGPNIKRINKANQAAIMRKIKNNQNSLLVEKLLPKNRVDDIKSRVSEWTIGEVKDFVNSIPGCAGCGELFELQEICGKSMLYLNQKDLLDVINIKLGPAVKIYHAISLLK